MLASRAARFIAVGAAVTAAVLSGTPSLASTTSSDGQSSAAALRQSTIHLIQSNQAVGTNVDVGRRGESVGDYVVITGPLLHPDSGQRAGFASVVCTVLRTGATAPLQCVGTASLAGGDITIQGLFVTEQGRPNRLAVTGGTGQFRTARGEFVATIEADGSTDALFRLTLDAPAG
ncbi:MAG TPA: hypothetical protein VFJ97_08910 [Dermatophilaceae bacterium]|nr:hypothetical protein [Dermatophilaceae bacterium]